jgi:hypothetical protein
VAHGNSQQFKDTGLRAVIHAATASSRQGFFCDNMSASGLVGCCGCLFERSVLGWRSLALALACGSAILGTLEVC